MTTGKITLEVTEEQLRWLREGAIILSLAKKSLSMTPLTEDEQAEVDKLAHRLDEMCNERVK